MHIKNLAAVPFEDILECFLRSFADYYVPMPSERSFYEIRWKTQKVDFLYSYGMFIDTQLVGFILHGIDTRFDTYIAHNVGTGVIPSQRRKGILSSLYNHAKGDLASNGIETSTLEVITLNKAALSLYERVGFKIRRKYRCYSGSIQLANEPHYKLISSSLKEADFTKLPRQKHYSWDHQKESILLGDFTFYQVMNSDHFESFFILNPSSGNLVQFDVFSDQSQHWIRLFAAIKSVCSSIRVINVDEALQRKTAVLEEIGLTNTIDQFEMEMKI